MRSYHQATGRAASAALALVLLTLAALTLLAGFVTHQAGQRVAHATVLHETFQQARFGLSTEIQRVHEYVATRSPRARMAFDRAAADVSGSLESVRGNGGPEVSATGADLLSLHEAFMAAAERAIAAADAAEEPEDEIQRQFGVDPVRAQLRDALEAWVELQEAQLATSVVELERITLLLWLGTPTMILVGMLILSRIWTRIQGQQKALNEATHRELEATRRTERRFDALLTNASDVIVLLGPDGGVEYASPSAVSVLGYQPASAPNVEELSFIHPEDRQRARDQVAQATAYPEHEIRGEIRFRHADGSWRHHEVVARSLIDDPELNGVLLTCHDITERKELEEQLRRLAFYDSLSGLPNRSLFLDRLEQALARGNRHARSVAVLFLDLDNFKVINDSLGHAVGDRLLEAVAVRLRDSLRAEDTVARFGGDEFAVLFEDVTDVRQAQDAAERIAMALRVPINLDNHEISPSFSIGIALSVPNRDTAQEVLRHADLAMYRAKANGKAQQAIFDQEMAVDAMDRLVLEADLRRAIPGGELRVHYQPIVELGTGAISEVEALVRWDHPRHGWMSPARFVPLAEETGLIVPLGQWVLEQACRQAQEWRTRLHHARNLVVSVNISALQFRQPTLVADVERVLQETGLPPTALKLEITESVLMQRAGSAIATMQTLKALGVQLAIDDYGTGYSSLSYLKQFPVDTVKIDRSFVHGVGYDHSDTAIVRSVVALARSLNLKVTAEGVESADQLQELQELGCDQAQGFYFAKPGSEDAVSDLLAMDEPLIGTGDRSRDPTAA